MDAKLCLRATEPVGDRDAMNPASTIRVEGDATPGLGGSRSVPETGSRET
jgi:hypothetical protein